MTGDLQDEDGELLTEENEFLSGSHGCQQVFTDKEGGTHHYYEMWMGEWWWKTQTG